MSVNATTRVGAVTQPGSVGVVPPGSIVTDRPVGSVGDSLFGPRPAGNVPVKYNDFRTQASISNPGVLATGAALPSGTQVEVTETLTKPNYKIFWYILGAILLIGLIILIIVSILSSGAGGSFASVSGPGGSSGGPPIPVIPCFLDFHRVLVVMSADGAEKNGARNVHSFTMRIMQVAFRRQSDQVWVGLSPPNIQTNLCEESINLVKLAQENRNVVIADGQGIKTSGFDRVRIKVSHLRVNDGCPVYTPGFPPTKVIEFPFTFFTPSTDCVSGESIGVLAIKIHLDSSLFAVSHRLQPPSCGELAGERIFAPNLQATSILSPTVQVDQVTGVVTITGGFTSFTQDNIGMDASGVMSIDGGIPPGSSQLYVIEGHVYVNIQPVPFPATWSACEPSSCASENCERNPSASASSHSVDNLSGGGESKNKYFESSSVKSGSSVVSTVGSSALSSSGSGGSATSGLSGPSKSCNCENCLRSRSGSASGSGSFGHGSNSGSSGSSIKCDSTKSCECGNCTSKRSSSYSSSKKHQYSTEIHAPSSSKFSSSETSTDNESSQ